MSRLRKILFVDRDGTLIEEPADEQVDSLDKLRLVPGVIPALLRLLQAGYELVLVSNQDGLGTDAFPEAEFRVVHDKMLDILRSQGIEFSAEHIDSTLPGDNAATRKPGIGMLLEYLRAGDLDFERSAVVGDRDTDLELAANLGLPGYRLDAGTGWDTIAHRILDAPRRATVHRETRETAIRVAVDLDADQPIAMATGIGFFDHMLEQLALHGGFAAEVRSRGDLHVDDHHSVEDTALALGEALDRALGDRRGIGRYGFVLPMDEALAHAAVDLSGRPWLELTGELPRTTIGGLSTEMVEHFFHSLSQSLRAAIHIEIRGRNSHHMVEAMFKGLGRALRPALARNAGAGLPSSKGVL